MATLPARMELARMMLRMVSSRSSVPSKPAPVTVHLLASGASSRTNSDA
jgi:hypothetical protein